MRNLVMSDWTIKVPFVPHSRVNRLNIKQIRWDLPSKYYGQVITVREDSYKPLKVGFQEIARLFRREEGYDFVQYIANENNKNCIGYAVVANHYKGRPLIGGYCFRLREYDEYKGWALQWCWLHPWIRGNGYTKELWPHFLEKFGDFLVEPPLSHAMNYFLKKYGTDFQKKMTV